MNAIRLFASLAVASAALLAAAPSMAQAPQGTPTRLRGTISAIDGKTVTIATREGTPVTVNLPDNWTVALVVPVALADIKPNSFVGVASMGSDADRTALEVLVFPEPARGSNEGHYPWDLQPQSMMTNATVATVAPGSDGQTLKLDYKDKAGVAGTQTVKVKPGTPVVTFEPGTQADAKVGAKVFVGASKAADGTLSAGRLNVGKDGLTPPM
jgi:hypothetical protein